MPKIICSAIHFDDGKVYVHQPKNIKSGFVICGRRHHNCFATYSIVKGAKLDALNKQGFLTDNDNFVDRNEAAKIAFENGQISKQKLTLFSEDLY
jgi:hypothetical protein